MLAFPQYPVVCPILALTTLLDLKLLIYRALCHTQPYPLRAGTMSFSVISRGMGLVGWDTLVSQYLLNFTSNGVAYSEVGSGPGGFLVTSETIY